MALGGALRLFARAGVAEPTGLPAWPRFDVDRWAAMLFDVESRVEDDPRGAERRLFSSAISVQPGT